MKLYTRTGDKGETGLFGGKRVSKASLRVSSYGEVDELNSTIGLVRAAGAWPELDAELERVQNELFNLGSLLAATPEAAKKYNLLSNVDKEEIERLEAEIDRSSSASEELKNFVLPGGTELAARLHFSRCVCRRAERSLVELAAQEGLKDDAVVYVNRLSDLLFAWAREANTRAGHPETLWKQKSE